MPSDQTTNERVARACGLRAGYSATIGDFLLAEFDFKWRKFDPEHSPSDALIAAEKYGLFDEERHGCELHRYGNKWHVVGYREPLASGTFCEVVCAAILRLEETGAAGDNGTQEKT